MPKIRKLETWEHERYIREKNSNKIQENISEIITSFSPESE